jgi:hypothetical protein
VPVTEHTPAPLLESTLNTTGFPDAPPVADNESDPPKIPAVGAVNEIVCGALATLKLRVAATAWPSLSVTRAVKV